MLLISNKFQCIFNCRLQKTSYLGKFQDSIDKILGKIIFWSACRQILSETPDQALKITKVIVIQSKNFGQYILEFPYLDLGCWEDGIFTGNERAVPPLEGEDPILDGEYVTRYDAINKCAQAARKRKYPVFVLQNGGWCGSSSDAKITFKKYGKSSACNEDGKGGPSANNVYSLKLQGM